MKCKICDKRPPRRHCPGVQGDICSICCGNEREVTIDCPLTCPYLIEARAREKRVPVNRDLIPNGDISLTESFLLAHKELAVYVAYALNQSIVKTGGAVDADVREALDGLTRTYRTLDAGLYHESRPISPYAAGIYDRVQEDIAEYRKEIRASGPLRDAEILGMLVVQQRFAHACQNGRLKGRAYIDFLRQQFEQLDEEMEANSPLIVL